ncbi:MAG: bstEII [Acidobacteria bacterium]|nr:bstEII [Acidobacteriota bacterium]
MAKQSPSKSFANYKAEAHNWITLTTGDYYPDILSDACELYRPVLVMFGQLLKSSESSQRLFLQINEAPDGWMRVQLARVFRKYVSPSTPVEMLKRKAKAREIIERFGAEFRPITQVQAAFTTRPIPDEALCAVLWEYKDRGKKGYDLTERFFAMFRSQFPHLILKGPERAGRDIFMGNVFEGYPNPTRPVDFVIYRKDENEVLAIGLARYDSDRGGSQEDDRTGQYRSAIDEILKYARKHNLKTKIIFLNDGPGLLLGSMWNDYAKLEASAKSKVLVLTLRMIPERLTSEWLQSGGNK